MNNDGSIQGNISQDARLERDILEQLLLSKHPMKYTSSKGPIYKTIKVLMFFIFIVTSLTILINNINFLNKINELSFLINDTLNNYSKIGMLIILSIYAFRVIYLIVSGKIIRHIRYDNVELTFELKNESPVDENINELIQFLRECRASIIVFEDLDRFDNIENILVKLKDINSIINTKKRNRFFLLLRRHRRMTFIYSVSDNEIEKAPNRTKFFDAIIPLRNVLDRETLTKEIKSLSKNIDISIIHLVNEHITDMRLLKSIKNDFTSIKKRNIIKGKNNTNQDNNIFTLSLYKNLFSSDYQLIYNFKSDINKVFNNRRAIINEINNHNVNEIIEVERKIKSVKEEEMKNKNELFILVGKIIQDTNQQSFVKIDEDYDFSDEKIKYTYKNPRVGNYSRVIYVEESSVYNFSKLDYENYKNRYYSLEYDVANLIKEKELINTKNEIVRELTLNELLNQYNDITKYYLRKNIKGIGLNFLIEAISGNYLNEKFQDLLFKPENLILQGNDQLFYRNARDRVPSIELELNNIELLIIEIKEELFDTTYIINNDLITFLFLKEDKRFTSKFNRIKKQFANNLDGIIKIYSIELIQKLDSNILIKLLIENKQLVEFIEKCSDEKKSDLIFSLMTKTNFETENKVLLNKLVNDYLDFSKIALDNDNKNVMDNIKRNNIKFSEINQDVELTKEIYSNGLFIINENNINFYIKKYRNDKTYNNILKDIIDDKLSISSILKNNFEYFIKNVWIKFPEVLEDNETIISLPNLKGVNKELFKDIIVKNGVKLYDINKLENSYLSIVLENKMLENRLTDLLYLINENNYSDYINDLTNVVIDTDNEVSIDEVILLVNNVKIDIRELEGIPIKKGEFDFTKVTNEKYLIVMFDNIKEENYGELMEYSFKNKMIEVQKKLFSSRPGYFIFSNISFILDELYELIFNENNSSNIESFIKDTPEIIMDNFDTNKNIFLPLIYDLAKEQKINKELVFKSYNVEQSNDLLVNQLKFDNVTKEDIIDLFKESQDYKKDITDVRTRFAIDLKDLELLNQLVINNIISLRKLRNNVEEDYYINYT